MTTPIERLGHDALWGWFELSRAGFLAMPRVCLHDMPDEWQAKLAALLQEWDDTWTNQPDIKLLVVAKCSSGQFKSIPEFLLNYRHPNRLALDAMKATS